MSRVMLVVGTRPEGIKMMPLYFALKQAGYNPFLCSTNQHDTLLTEVLALFGMKPDHQLHVMQKGQDLFHITTTILDRIKKIFLEFKPSAVFVQGDTTTVMAAGMAAFYLKIPIVHIEAGLRTGDKESPFPEEFNRQMLGLIADYHFAPTSVALANLLAEQKVRSSVFCVGNTVVDALRLVREKIESGEIVIRPDIERAVAGCIVSKQRMVLLTVHRRESLAGPLVEVLQTIKKIALQNPDLYIFYPYHPNPSILKALQEVPLDKVENIYLTEPLAYKDLVYLLSSVDLVATDSGGVQEEAVSLGKKVLVLREKSDRMESVWEGYASVVGTDPEKIKKAFEDFLMVAGRQNEETNHLYGDGYAAEKIVRILETSKVLSVEKDEKFIIPYGVTTSSLEKG